MGLAWGEYQMVLIYGLSHKNQSLRSIGLVVICCSAESKRLLSGFFDHQYDGAYFRLILQLLTAIIVPAYNFGSLAILQLTLLASALEALTIPINIFNEAGTITFVNQAWKRFADSHQLKVADYGLGHGFLALCQQINLDHCPLALAQGIEQVIHGQTEEFRAQYPCLGDSTVNWFQIRVVPLAHEGRRYAIAMHENITDSSASENRLRNILENAPIGMAIISLDGHFIEVNKALEDIVGYSKAELLQLTCQQIQYPADTEVDHGLLQGLIQKVHDTYKIEKRFLRKDGQVVWVNLTCSVLRDELGKPILIIKQIQDITERRQTEASLRNSEHRLGVVVDNMPALIGYWNKDLINEFGNKAYIDLFGVSPEQIKGMHIRDVIGEQLFAQNQLYIKQVLQGKQQIFERTIPDTSGIDHYTLVSYVPDIAEQGVNGFFVLVTDITKIKTAEIELRKSERLNRKLLSVSLDGFIFAELDGRFLDANAAFCQMLGYSRDEILTMSFADIESAQNAEHTAHHIGTIISRGFDKFETAYCCKDGSVVDVEVSIVYLDDNKKLFSFTRDITQRKQAEKLRIRQLEQQRDVLVREVHHRIKNHLQGLLGLLNLYSYKNPHEQHFIENITAKINSIAVVYGIQGRKNPNSAYLCEITQEICKSMDIISPGDIAYLSDGQYGALLPSEYAVPVALIINELITNAIKHSRNTTSGKVSVNLSINAGSATLIISNPCFQCQAFPDFSKGQGLGVGLSLVRAMLPLAGMHLSLVEKQGMVCAELRLEAPVISTQRR